MYGLSEESLTIVGIILIVVGVAMIGVIVLATGIMFVMQLAMN